MRILKALVYSNVHDVTLHHSIGCAHTGTHTHTHHTTGQYLWVAFELSPLFGVLHKERQPNALQIDRVLSRDIAFLHETYNKARIYYKDQKVSLAVKYASHYLAFCMESVDMYNYFVLEMSEPHVFHQQYHFSQA